MMVFYLLLSGINYISIVEKLHIFVYLFYKLYMDKNKRIVKNTIFLYIRMLITMGVTLYTSRVVLNILGVEDFGIYNITGGIVVLFSFLNTAMSNATQRFLSFELGKNDIEQLKRTFCMSINAHISIALLVLFLSETVGLWFINSQLNIPTSKMVATNWVYQFSVFSFLVSIIRVPYNASIIAYEKMSFFASISILEAIFKLLIVFLLTISIAQKLIFYSILTFSVILICTIIYKIYCNKHFIITRYNFFWDKELYKRLMSFSAWSMLGGATNIGAQQGGNILLNIFYGVSVNTAFGLANQVSNAIYGFVSNFQLAFNPQIIKYYANKEIDKFNKLIFTTSLFSYYLILIIAIPFLFNTEFILLLWLKNVPSHTVVFCQLMMIYFLIDAIQGPLWMSIYATGNIRIYQIWLSILLILNIPISYFLLKNGHNPCVVLIVRVCLNFISGIARIIYVNYFLNFPSTNYLKAVVLKATIVSLIVLSFSFIAKFSLNGNLNFLLIIISIISTIIIIYLIGITKHERIIIINLLQYFKK